MDAQRKPEHVPREWEFTEVFDALDLGCGQLLLDFRMQLEPLPVGAVILLASRDIASPMEIPAWCRLTGHRLVDSRPPYYLIEKRISRRKGAIKS